MDKYGHVGKQLGIYILANAPRIQQIQGLLSDLLIDDDLLVPMRDAVSRPTFLSLYELIGSGRGSLQRDALLQDLSRSYLPVVVAQIRVLLNGMLNIEEMPRASKAALLGNWMWLPLGVLAILVATALLYRGMPPSLLNSEVRKGPSNLKLKKPEPDRVANKVEEEISETAPIVEARLPAEVQFGNGRSAVSEMTEAEQVSYLVNRCEAAIPAISRLEEQRPDIITDPSYKSQLYEFWSYARSVYPSRPLDLEDVVHLMHDFPLVKMDYSLSVQIAKKAHLDVLYPFMEKEANMDGYHYRVGSFLGDCNHKMAAWIVHSWRRNAMRPLKGLL